MIKYDDIKVLINGILDIDSRLRQVEVKGDSLEPLLAARMLLRQLTLEIEKLKEKEE